jgi:hypothetical protein
MAKRGRPFAYQSDDEKPVTVSLRLPREVYTQVERYVHRHPGMTLTEFMLDGIRLRLDTPADPRDLILSDGNTVIQELQEMIRAAVQAEIGKLSDFMGRQFNTPGVMPTAEAPAESVPELSHDDNTVIQEGTAHEQQTGRGHTAAAVPLRRGLNKLTPRQVNALRAKRARGVPVKALMEEYGVSKATVFRYLAEG